MLLYNITVIIEEEIEVNWLKWIREVGIPEVMSTQNFISVRLLKLLNSPNEGVTYCIQYVAETLEKFNSYKANFESPIQARHHSEFANRLVTFSSLMEYIDHI